MSTFDDFLINEAVGKNQEISRQEISRLMRLNLELLKALKACYLQMLQSNNDSEYAREAGEMAMAAIRHAEEK